MSVGDETIRNVNLVTSHDPLLGQTVEQYKIESLIGTGAMGYVYRGVHQVIGKAAAIKVLKPDYADDPEMVQRLVREARSVNAIRHPAIVDIFGFGTLKNGQPYIVMDLLEGEPLDQYIRDRGPLKAREVVALLDELLSALAAAHKVGVIHRDLKPGNVFVETRPDGKKGIKVIDFGLAKQADRANGSVKPTNPGTMLGTPAFMAPEQVLGTKVTPATDLYAVGGIAYQMLTCHLPHEGPTAIDVLQQKMQQAPIRPRQWQPTLDEDLDTWVMTLLERESTARPQDAEEARLRLRRVADGRTQLPAAVAAAKPGRTGVVPGRSWNDAPTTLDHNVAERSERSTERFPALDDAPGPVSRVEDSTLPPVSRGRRDVLTIAASPDEVLASIKASQPALSPVDDDTANLRQALPNRTGLYVALGITVVVLAVGLVLLLL